jgi:N-formylglutamate deformylase
MWSNVCCEFGLMVRKTNPGVLYVEQARRPAVPVVFDSPHSGQTYPEDFNCVVPTEVIRCAEDMFVDELFEGAPLHGAELLAALFPRSYIDPNRSLGDLDARLLDAPWPEPLEPGEKTRRGHGLIWHTCPPDLPMYDRKLTKEEVRRRIDDYYLAYHETLDASLNRLYGKFGHVWHINCHSMPAFSGTMSPGPQRARCAEFVLGDRDGTTCAPEFTTLVRETLENFGYSVRVNNPYKGVELVRAYSDPEVGRHSIQVEISRSLYMDEATFMQTDGFEALKSKLSQLAAVICAYARERSANGSTG